ncbi:hypothetical protein TH63_14705 [Rufibacter radiotolerans]|uniref:isocitrate dehydrogenase (NADP(+)) n=1 Tax=Rufibacter radiotolerans TaxID=1379910 RepID=A0A0H4W841_9BACT|nr:NADP-dependent isocitrate dehydrogenase [Rufibacter radiotolerans]AKQ46596.1 hypothetical protein TH63_14705 [Rufibacter radiotolerans]
MGPNSGRANHNEELKTRFTDLAQASTENGDKIVQEQIAAQGKSVDMGGYFHPDTAKVAEAMRPSATLNSFLDQF